jgi:predicted SprT family Zn-dependent metalloprotease
MNKLNKYQEALWNVTQKLNGNSLVDNYEKDLPILQELVDKETTMKVSIIDRPDLFYIYYCPDCGATLLVDRSGHPKHLFNYCGKCRRKLDWSEEND